MKHNATHSFTFLITLLCITFLSITSQAQNTSPVYAIEFNKIQNGIMDEGKLQKNQLTDYDDNPVCLLKVKSQGFDEATLQKIVFVPRNIMIMHKAYENGEYRLYVSSRKPGSILIKYQGEYEFKLPYNLEPKKIYELVLGMETATLNIITTPDNAAIYIDDEKVGVGHGSKAVSIGAEHRYKVECEDYITEENAVTFTQNEKKELNIELRPDFGYITVKSTPGGAEVYIDKKKAGVTPYLMEKIKRGQHVVEVRKEGYEPFANVVTIKAGEMNNQFENVVLEAVRVLYGKVYVVSSPSGADITIDNDYKGKTPMTIDKVPVGSHNVTLTYGDYAPAMKTVMVEDGKTASVNVTLTNGRNIEITTDRQGDQIYADGNYLGLSPLTATLSFGSHNIKAVRDSKSVEKTITVAQTGGDSSVRLVFKQEINGHEYVDLGLPSGTLWATCNVGASKPEDYGNYYAWGETATKSTYSWSTYKWFNGSYNTLTKYNTNPSYGTVDHRTVLEMGDDAARANWGGSWRMPIRDEMQELIDRCTWTWTTQGGKSGYRVTGPNGKSIFLPAAGAYDDGSLIYAGSYGGYWSSSLRTDGPDAAYYLYFSSGDLGMYNCDRRDGPPVRPVSASQK